MLRFVAITARENLYGKLLLSQNYFALFLSFLEESSLQSQNIDIKKYRTFLNFL